ncbi:hypothetical protein [uncultured Campylobacter sp.]|nr:hypothetical protein [uncultured Campylobacter sp.]
MGFTYGEVLKFMHGAGLKFMPCERALKFQWNFKILCRVRDGDI